MLDEAIAAAKDALRDLESAPVQGLRQTLEGLLGSGWLDPESDYLETTLYWWGLTSDDLSLLPPAVAQAPYDQGERLVAWFNDLMARPAQMPVGANTEPGLGAQGPTVQGWSAPHPGGAPGALELEIQPIPGFPEWWGRQDTSGQWLYLRSAGQPTAESPGWLDRAMAYELMTGGRVEEIDESGGYAGDALDDWTQMAQATDDPWAPSQ